MKLNFLINLLGSGFYTGFLPKMPGTFASLAALLIYMIPGFENPVIMIFIVSLFFVIGVKTGNKFEEIYGKDPSKCTIDEVTGMWLSLLFVPKYFPFVLGSFLLFRIFDIIKPFPARTVEKIDGGLGIMLDDIIAAIYTLIVIHPAIYIINYFIN